MNFMRNLKNRTIITIRITRTPIKTTTTTIIIIIIIIITKETFFDFLINVAKTIESLGNSWKKILSNSNEISENLWKIFSPGRYIKSLYQVMFNSKVLKFHITNVY